MLQVGRSVICRAASYCAPKPPTLSLKGGHTFAAAMWPSSFRPKNDASGQASIDVRFEAVYGLNPLDGSSYQRRQPQRRTGALFSCRNRRPRRARFCCSMASALLSDFRISAKYRRGRATIQWWNQTRSGPNAGGGRAFLERGHPSRGGDGDGLLQCRWGGHGATGGDARVTDAVFLSRDVFMTAYLNRLMGYHR
jgi:hypothetical protein